MSFSVHCTNEEIEIVDLSDTRIQAVCRNCGKSAVARREDFNDEEWQDMVSDANKHINGEFSKEAA